MPFQPPSPLANAAEARRREMPAAVALVILTGGLAAAIIGGSTPVYWAALMSLLLITDTEIYRRLEAAETVLTPPRVALLAGWAFLTAAFYAVLPIMLWLDAKPAGAAAAMVLWVAAVVRQFNGGSGKLAIAVAGAAPAVLSLLAAPLALAAISARPDWDVGVIAAIGGAALMAYVTQARLSAVEAERKLQRAAAAQSLQQTLAQLLFEEAALRAFLIDNGGRVVMMSKHSAEGWCLEDVAGRPFEQVCPWSMDRWRDTYRRVLTGEHVRVAEDEAITPDGRRWHEWEARPWLGPDGAVCGVLAFGRDITSLVLARRAAAANEERLHVALDAGRSVVWETDLAQNKVTWFGDAADIYGSEMDFESFNADKMPQLLDEDRAAIKQAYQDTLAGKSESFEHRIRKPDGAIAWVQVWVRGIKTRAGVLRTVVGLSKDITTRKEREEGFLAAMVRAEKSVRSKRALLTDASARRAEEPTAEVAPERIDISEMFVRLDGLLDEMDVRDALLAETLASLREAREMAERASISKSNFLASMSHELRTPLNAIVGYSEILMEDAEADGRDSDKKDLARVLTAARQLLHLINDILDLSKIEAGRMDISVSAFEAAAMIQDAVAIVRPAMEKNDNRIEVSIEGELGEVTSDPFKLNQCLLNLLSNASKFTEKGVVSVRARRVSDADGECIEIAVKDTGIGMTADQVSRLFNAFVQADAATSRKYGGTGLGLAITRRMMRMLGGDVGVQSAAGLGSTFTLRFPVQLGEGAAQPKPDLGALPFVATGHTVLVIDDEESARDLVKRALSRLGFAVREAATAAAGLDIARATRLSAILLDINLPDMSGWELLPLLKDAGESAATPVIIHSINDDRQRALALGACAHLVKPADRDVLAAAVARIVRPTPAAAEAAQSQPAAPASFLAKTA